MDPSAREVFEDLHGRYARRLWSLAYHLSGRRDEADELVQAAMARAWERFAELRDPARFFAWVRAILANLWRDRLRERRIEPAATAPEPSPLSRVLDRERRALLRAAVQSLPERDRVVLDLAHLQGLRDEEIARVLGLSPGHVRVLLHRARRRLAGRLRDAFSQEAP